MPWIIPAIGAVSSVVGSALGGNRSTTPTLSPELQALQSKLLGFSGSILDNPSAGMEGMKINGIDQINRNYAQMPDLVSRTLAARGFGKSGKLGTAMFNTSAARLGTLGDFQSQFNQMVLNRQMQAAGLSEQLLNSGRGSTTNAGGVGPGLMSAGNGLENLSTLLMLSNVLKGSQTDPNFQYYSGGSSFTAPGGPAPAATTYPWDPGGAGAAPKI